jgi:hypothetical protein
MGRNYNASVDDVVEWSDIVVVAKLLKRKGQQFSKKPEGEKDMEEFKYKCMELEVR